MPVASHRAAGGLHAVLRQSRDGRALSRPHRNLTIDRGEVYSAVNQAGPGNDINVGSSGSQKAPTWSPASLVAIRANASQANPPFSAQAWRASFARDRASASSAVRPDATGSGSPNAVTVQW
jgi:hypothetical protein